MMQFITDNIWHGAVITAASCLLICIAVMDIRTLEIPNVPVMAILGLGIVDFFVWGQLAWHEALIGFVCVSIPMVVIDLIIPGAFGGGDIKLCAACGVLLGWRGIIEAIVIAVLAGGLYGAMLLLVRRRSARDVFAFGPFIACGVLAVMWLGEAIFP